MLNVTLLSIAGCQVQQDEIVVGGQTYRKSDVTYVEQIVNVSSYQFPRKPVGALGIAQVRLRAQRLSAESVSLRGSLAPLMDELTARFEERADQEVFSIHFLDGDGKEITHQGVNYGVLVATEGDRYAFSIDVDIDADRFDSVESIAIDWSKRLDDAVAAFIESDEGRIWVNEH